MSDAALEVHRTDRVNQARKTPSSRGWMVGLAAIAGTFVLLWLASPGLRTDVNGLVALVSNVSATGITNWILSFGTWAPFIYLSIMVAQVIVSPIPAGPVALAGALIFGVWEGLALALTGSVIGSVLIFIVARRWGEPLVIRLVGERIYRKYIGILDAKGWWLFAILLLPFMPDDAVCALAGLSAISFRRFLAVMVVGRIPGSTMTALLASDWVTSSTATWISVGLVVTVILALGFVYKERLESWMFRRADDGQASVDLVEVPLSEDVR